MDKNKKPVKRLGLFKKRAWLWQSVLALVLISAGIYGIFFGQISSQTNDLSLIGKGENVIVHVHDPG